jgi:hypothetical protein
MRYIQVQQGRASISFKAVAKKTRSARVLKNTKKFLSSALSDFCHNLNEKTRKMTIINFKQITCEALALWAIVRKEINSPCLGALTTSNSNHVYA